MSPQGYPAPPAFEADDVIPVNGLPDRYGWLSLRLCGSAQRFKRPVDPRDEVGQIRGRDLVLCEIAADDLGDQWFEGRGSRAFVCCVHKRSARFLCFAFVCSRAV
jgi:hypothetical protein